MQHHSKIVLILNSRFVWIRDIHIEQKCSHNLLQMNKQTHFYLFQIIRFEICSASTKQWSLSLSCSLKPSQSILVVVKLSIGSFGGHCGKCMHNAVRQQRLTTQWLTRQSGEHALWLSCDNAGTERGQTSADLVGRKAFAVFAVFQLSFRDRLHPLEEA